MSPVARSLLRRALFGLVFLALTVAGGAWLLDAAIDPDLEAQGGDPRPGLEAVRTWGIQLQALDTEVAARSEFDLLVVDPAAMRTNPAAAVNHLKMKPDGTRRIVLAHLPVGAPEAPSATVAKEDEPPAFWSPEWRSQLFGAPPAVLDRLLAHGFDGVMLDRAAVTAAHRVSHPPADRAMVELIVDLARYARERVPGFLVVLNNAGPLLLQRGLRAELDGVAMDNLLFGKQGPGRPNDEADIAASLGVLERARDAGRPVLVLEYLSDPQMVAWARHRLAGLGLVPYFAPRDLERLNVEN